MTRPSDLYVPLNTFGVLLLLSALLCCGCNRRPEGVLSDDEMASLMADMQLAEAYSNVAGISRIYSDDRERIGKGVMLAHGVTQEQLDTTLAWYGRNLDDYSELYDKVDKEIAERRKKLMNEEDSESEFNSADMLWPYISNGVLSALGNTDSWILSLESPELERGDILEWSMRVIEPVQMNGVLGVEYTDGTSDAATHIWGGQRKLEVRLMTDTGKVVKRIYGTIRLKDESQMPVFADSIMLRRLPYDSLEYVRSHGLRHYGVPVRVKVNKEVAESDTVANDSLAEPVKFKIRNFEAKVTDRTSKSAVRPPRRDAYRNRHL